MLANHSLLSSLDYCKPALKTQLSFARQQLHEGTKLKSRDKNLHEFFVFFCRVVCRRRQYKVAFAGNCKTSKNVHKIDFHKKTETMIKIN